MPLVFPGRSKYRNGTGTGLRKRTAGFTLVELIVVVVIIGTMVATVSALIADLFVGRSARDEADRLVKALHFCRQKAVIGGRPVYLSFNLKKHYYQAWVLDGHPSNPKKAVILEKSHYGESDGIVDIQDVHGGKHTDTENYIILFQPNGMSQSVLLHFGDGEEGSQNIERTVYLSRFSSSIKSMAGNITKVSDFLSEEEKEEAEAFE